MAGKYTKVAKGIPKVDPKDLKHLERVQVLKGMLTTIPEAGPEPDLEAPIEALQDRLTELVQSVTGILGGGLKTTKLVKAYGLARELKDGVSAMESQINLLLDALEQFLKEAYEAEGLTSVNVEGLGTLSINPQPQGKVTDPAAFRKWCMENGYEEALTLPWATMSALVRERLLERMAMPPGVEARIDDDVRLTREKL